jgi:hypothetical protein
VDLLAPGEDVEFGQLTGEEVVDTGTSLAAPHVTATVALLNQYSDFQITNAGWDFDNARRHEVLKSILLNSADKISGELGSTRTVQSSDDTGNYIWTSSPAFFDDSQSLDVEMGAGHLNAGRALTQLQPGEWDVGSSIPPIGWDYHETGGPGTLLSYPFADEISGYIAITLAWDRVVDKIGGLDETYDPTNMFIGADPDDLDIYLVPVGWDNLFVDAVAKSITIEDNVEHIFASVAPGNYEIVVQHFGGNSERDYGLAWWTGSGVPLAGDFDHDDNVDGDDLIVWRGDFGMNGDSDADGDGDSDGNDFLVWQQNLGATAATPNTTSIPEPSCLVLCLGAVLFRRKFC